MNFEMNQSDFPAEERGLNQRLFIRFDKTGDFYKIFKSVTLPDSPMAMFITNGDNKSLTIMCEKDRCIQGIPSL